MQVKYKSYFTIFGLKNSLHQLFSEYRFYLMYLRYVQFCVKTKFRKFDDKKEEYTHNKIKVMNDKNNLMLKVVNEFKQKSVCDNGHVSSGFC